MARVAGAKNRFKLSEIQRAVRAARGAGLTIARIEVDQTGKFAVIAGEPAGNEAGQKAGPEPSDADLDRELAELEKRDGSKVSL